MQIFTLNDNLVSLDQHIGVGRTLFDDIIIVRLKQLVDHFEFLYRAAQDEHAGDLRDLSVAVCLFLHTDGTLRHLESGVGRNDNFDWLFAHGNHFTAEFCAFHHQQSCIAVTLMVDGMHGYFGFHRSLRKVYCQLLTDLQTLSLLGRNLSCQIPVESLNDLAERIAVLSRRLLRNGLVKLLHGHLIQ